MSIKEQQVAGVVLVVDDEKMTRELLGLMLTPAGFEVFFAEDGVDALEKLAERKADVVVLDVMMPRMDGVVTCQNIRSNPETADIPVIMLSAKTHGTAVAEGLAAGANQYLTKPIARKLLIETINTLIAQSKNGNGPDTSQP